MEKLTGKSRRTVAKYLDEVASEVAKYNVTLVRKPNVGIRLEGDTEHLIASLDQFHNARLDETVQDRTINILSTLLRTAKPQYIQDLADQRFVSRSTLESNLKFVREFLSRFDAELISTRDGISIKASEQTKRKMMSALISTFWGGLADSPISATNGNFSVSIPPELKYLFNEEVVDRVVDVLNKFQDENVVALNDYEFQSLAIHLVIAIERLQRGLSLSSDTSKVSGTSISDATAVLSKMLENEFSLKIPQDEREYINLHMMAADEYLDENSRRIFGVNYPQNDVAQFLIRVLPESDDVLIKNLTLHLMSALKRLTLGLSIHNPYTEVTKKSFPYAYNKAVDLGEQIASEYGVDLNEDELAFIALHIETYMERQPNKISAVIVCSTGLGTARLLEQRIHRYFENQIEVKRVLSISDLKRAPIVEDLIISTIKLDIDGVATVIVPPFLDDFSRTKISHAVNVLSSGTNDSSQFMRLVHRSAIVIDGEKASRNQAISKIGNVLIRAGFGKEKLVNAAINREDLASTQIGNVAMPHVPISYVNKPCIGIYVNPQGVTWSDGTVNVVFFLAMNSQLKPVIQDIYEYFNSILEDSTIIRKLTRASNAEEIMNVLRGDECDK